MASIEVNNFSSKINGDLLNKNLKSKILLEDTLNNYNNDGLLRVNQNSSINEVNNLLEKYKTFGTTFNYVSQAQKSKYYIAEDDIVPFLDLYSKCLSEGYQNFYLAEKPLEYFPLRVDFDFKLQVNKDNLEQDLEHQYTDEMIKSIVKIYQDELKNIIDPEYFEPRQLYCLVLTKNARVDEKDNQIIKDGLHLHFPHFICNWWIQDSYLRERVIHQMMSQCVWGGTSYIKIEKSIDQLKGKYWLLYGSKKKETLEPFVYYKSINENGDFFPLKSVFIDEMVGREGSCIYYLPIFLSLRIERDKTSLKDEIMREYEEIKTIRRITRVVPTKKSPLEIMEQIKEIKDSQLLDMISDDRADDRSDWMHVGYALFSIGAGCPEGSEECLQLWIEFSKRSPKCIEGECEDEWQKMEPKDGGYTIATLYYFAKTDSPERYKGWIAMRLKNILDESLKTFKPNEYELAQVIYKTYETRFKCVNARKNEWYEFKNGKWQKLDNATSLLSIMRKEVARQYIEYQISLAKEQKKYTEEDSSSDSDKSESSETEDGDEEGVSKKKNKKKNKKNKKKKKNKKGDNDPVKYIQLKMKRCNKIITFLRESHGNHRILDMCKSEFHDAKFLEQLDTNTKLFGCENGVLDLENGVFREGRPEDNLSISCGQYYKEYKENDKEVQNFMLAMRKIFPNENIFNFAFDVVSQCLEGGNIHKLIILAIGKSDGGKSAFFELILKTFGQYGFTFPVEVFTVNKFGSGSGPRPELARSDRKRFANVPEIGKDHMLDAAALKRYSGNDTYYARSCGQDGGDLNNSFTLFTQLNYVPPIPLDDALWDRMRFVDFEAKFVKPRLLHEYPVPATPKEQFEQKRFHADMNFKDKYNLYSNIMLWFLFKRYCARKNKDLIEPDEVKKTTQKIKNDKDLYKKFFEEKITKSENPADFLTRAELHSVFVDWYNVHSEAKTRQKITPEEIEEQFTKYLGSSKRKKSIGWSGWVITQDEETLTKINVKSLLIGKKG